MTWRRPGSPATLLVLHDAGADGQPSWAGGWARVGVEPAGHGDRVPPSASNQPLVRTDHDLACLRSAVLDLHAVLTAWRRRTDERILLLASGVAASGALVALGAGLAADVGAEDALRHELLLDLREGDALHARIADAVASRIAAAVLIDPAGAASDWRDVALARIATPVALVEHRGSTMARCGFTALEGADRLHARVDAGSGVVGLLTSLASRPAREVFEAVAGRPLASARPDASGIGEARHARGCPAESWPMEICRSDFAPGLLRSLWLAATQAGLRPRWS